jgi:hypothetical protein
MKIAGYHANLDKIGSSYFIQENYDDFLLWKRIFLPDINGSMESYLSKLVRGHAKESANGIITFHLRLNQFTTSLSTLQATSEMRTDLLAYQRDFMQC